MCRHLGYLGPPAAVGSQLTRGPHSLYTQSWQPRDMRGGGTVNADGFGVAWWVSPSAPAQASATEGSPAGERVASRYRNAAPIWADPAVDEVLPQLHSTAVLAAVRSATVGMPVERAACAPFTSGRWAFSHNGRVADWQRVLTEVAAEFGSPALLEAEARTDSAALWVILRALLETGSAAVESATSAAVGAAPEVRYAAADSSTGPREGTGREPGGSHRGASGVTVSGDTTTSWSWSVSHSVHSVTTRHSAAAGEPAAAGPAAPGHETDTRPDDLAAGSAVIAGTDPAEALRQVVLAVLAREPAARLNLLLGDGETLWATTRHHSLSVLVTDEFAVVSSEPYDDDPRWRAVADRQLVTLRPGLLSVVPLDPDSPG
ncbi:Gamma-glutamyl-hercynylcysteine sulfoxide hydrolase [Nocardia sp. RB56]|uniref:Gamma-glutamyl-hercynylcysteine sulfoxide hydrolase n=1 Tax=Nocardia aurantia TaxID=2585199 RepID=A0A7K0DHJ7_9NOCA|nr:class II glutamine amidotransferase [Nocardia aurantia]MQY25088.1 Gamma-glutamyl-hercynylcysteine sulfoxide hydrolase [Nocardia aurantia]